MTDKELREWADEVIRAFTEKFDTR